jgi:hypothetical protein
MKTGVRMLETAASDESALGLTAIPSPPCMGDGR